MGSPKYLTKVVIYKQQRQRQRQQHPKKKPPACTSLFLFAGGWPPWERKSERTGKG